MATTLTSKLVLSLTASLVNDNTLAPGTSSLSNSTTLSFADGTAINQANRMYANRLALSTTPTDLDFSGSLADPLGNTITFAKINGIFIKNLSSVAAEIVSVGGDAASVAGWVGAVNDLVKVGPGGVFALFNPALAAYTVTATTGDILQLVADSGTPSVDIVVIGRSA